MSMQKILGSGFNEAIYPILRELIGYYLWYSIMTYNKYVL